MSGHLDLLCVRGWGNGWGYKINPRPLARITAWKMLKWTVRSYYGRWIVLGRVWDMLVMMWLWENTVYVTCLWPLFVITPSPTLIPFIPFEVKSAIVVGQKEKKKKKGFTTWFRGRFYPQIRFLVVELWSMVHLSTDSGEAIWGCQTRLWRLGTAVL